MKILSEQQALQQIDSEQIYDAWFSNRRHVLAHRYGMRWMRSGGHEYLLRLTDAKGNGRSLGPRSAETERLYAEFQRGKERAEERDKVLRERLTQQARMNKALRLGRAPAIVGEILRAIELPADGEFLVVGTHALFAYEAMAGVHLVTDLLASGDVDLLMDGRKRVSILSEKLAPEGLIGHLRKADKTFDLIHKESYRAVNASGFMVDLLIPPRDMRDTEAVSAQAGDLVAIEVPGLQWLLNAPQVRAVAIGGDGIPFALRVPDPRVFCLHKAWLSERPNREPIKKGRDLAQAKALAELIQERLPHYPLNEAFLASVPKALSQIFGRLVGPAPLMGSTIMESDRAAPKPKFKSDIPSEDWLREKLSQTQEDGRNPFGVPKTFGPVTGSFDRALNLPVDVLLGVPGERDEQNHWRPDSLASLRENIERVTQNPVYVEVDPNGKAWVNEGNHRIRVAAERGLTHLQVEVRYFSGGERLATDFAPGRLMELDAAVDAAVAAAVAAQAPAEDLMPGSDVRQEETPVQRASLSDRAELSTG